MLSMGCSAKRRVRKDQAGLTARHPGQARRKGEAKGVGESKVRQVCRADMPQELGKGVSNCEEGAVWS